MNTETDKSTSCHKNFPEKKNGNPFMFCQLQGNANTRKYFGGFTVTLLSGQHLI